MNTAVELIESGAVCRLDFDLPTTVWQEIMSDNVSLLTDEGGFLSLFSFITGAELLRVEAGAGLIARMNQFGFSCLNRKPIETGSLNEDVLILKKERFDCTGQFAAGIRNQATGNIEGAIKNYQVAIAAEPLLERALNLLGLCQRISGNVAEAEISYLKAMEVGPDAPEAFCNLGILYQKAGREDEAQKLFEQALNRDQFYFNALLRRAEWLLQSGQLNNSPLSELNLRLLMHYSEVGAVQRHLFSSAQRFDLAIEEYAEKLHNENGGMANAKIQSLQRRIESLLINGAYPAAIENMQLLKSMTPQTHAEKVVVEWCGRRADNIRNKMRNAGDFKFLQILEESFRPSEPSVTAPDNKKTPLGVAEFFSLVLLEVMRDGQIEPAERDLLHRLRVALHVPEDAYITMFNNVRRQLDGIEVTGGLREKFSHQRLFRNLCLAAFRDGVIEDGEKKILGFACKAFDISSEEFKRIIAEVPK